MSVALLSFSAHLNAVVAHSGKPRILLALQDHRQTVLYLHVHVYTVHELHVHVHETENDTGKNEGENLASLLSPLSLSGLV